MVDEIKALSSKITVIKVTAQGVEVSASLDDIYRICLWSRLANRVYLILFSGKADNQEALYQLSYQFNWQKVFTHDKTLAIDFQGTSDVFRNSMFGAQVIKDGIVDYFRQLNQVRPVIDKSNPQVRLHAYLKRNKVTLSLNLTGHSLHQRGYRQQTGTAPLKENIAAALLIRANWPTLAKAGYAFFDPLCGSGTLVIEAALMAANIAPGLINTNPAFVHWLDHQPTVWQAIQEEARQQKCPSDVLIVGSDNQARMISIAQANANRAGVAHLITFKHQSLSDTQALAPLGLIITNPPYGERLSETEALLPLYRQLGKIFHNRFPNWQAAILSNNIPLVKAIGLRSHKQHAVMNGALECQLFHFDLNNSNRLKDTQALSDANVQTLLDRLNKNYRHLDKWAKKNNIECYRLYDADLPQYAYAIDLYQNHAVLQEYKAPAAIPVYKAEQRSREFFQAVLQVLSVDSNALIIKQRQSQKGLQQYQKINQLQKTLIVRENNALFKVNLSDYLDTGLFLDHRPLRKTFAGLTKGTRFLNCFCYTATASVQAALAGAITTSVDLSNTYLNWAKENFQLNKIDLQIHQFIQADCLEWLRNTYDKFDVIFLDPPSFSNSKRMQGILDIQKDHLWLIKHAMRLLNVGGMLYFSTNLRSFKMDLSISKEYQIIDITNKTLDIDFKRNTKIHHCFTIQAV